MRKILTLFFVTAGIVLVTGCGVSLGNKKDSEATTVSSAYRAQVEKLVRDHAKAWSTGDVELLKSTMHEDIVFAYPGRRLNYDEVVADLEYFRDNFEDIKVYFHNVIIDGDKVAVEWQFAYTDSKTGKRAAVSDGIIGEIRDGKIVSWKEYLDGRVSRMQVKDELPLEEGEEPFPWPKKPKTPTST